MLSNELRVRPLSTRGSRPVNGRREHAARGLGAKVPDTHCRRRHSGRSGAPI